MLSDIRSHGSPARRWVPQVGTDGAVGMVHSKLQRKCTHHGLNIAHWVVQNTPLQPHHRLVVLESWAFV